MLPSLMSILCVENDIKYGNYVKTMIIFLFVVIKGELMEFGTSNLVWW